MSNSRHGRARAGMCVREANRQREEEEWHKGTEVLSSAQNIFSLHQFIEIINTLFLRETVISQAQKYELYAPC